MSSLPLDSIFTTDEVANEIGCSPDTVARVARESHKPDSEMEALGRQVGGVWVFTRGQANKLGKLIQPRAGRTRAASG